MVSKRDIKILTELLDLSDVKVISHRLHAEIGIILQTESKNSYGTCPKCGTISHKLHQNHRHIIKDLQFGEKSVYLEINRRQFKCEKCRKPFREEGASTFGVSTFLDEPYSRVFGVPELCFFQKWMLPAKT